MYQSKRPQNMWKITHIGLFLKIIFGTFRAQIWPHILHVPTYGWYGFNAQNKWKISHFGLFFKMIFGTLGAQIWPHILLQMQYECLSYLWCTQSCMYQWEIWSNIWMIWLLCCKCVKNSSKKTFEGLRPLNIAPGSPKQIFVVLP